MTNPVNSKHWASQVDAVTREYIDARIHEELKPMKDDIAALRVAILATRESLQRDMGNVAGRMSNTEELLEMSSSRAAKLASIAKQMDEES
jgi:hypothetical protein